MSDSKPETEKKPSKWAWISNTAVVLFLITTIVQLPKTYNDWTSLGDGPHLTVSGASGPYESIEKPTDPKLKDMVWFTRLKIGNEGNQTASELEIQWNVEGYASIIDIDGKTRTQMFSKRLPLGKLPVGNEYEVRIWTKEQYSKEGGSQPLLTHDSDDQPIFQDIESTWQYWITLSAAIVLMIIGALSSLFFLFVISFLIYDFAQKPKLADLEKKWAQDFKNARSKSSTPNQGKSESEIHRANRPDSSSVGDTENKEPFTTDDSK